MSQTRSGYRSSTGGLVGALIASAGLIALVGLLTLFQARDGDDPTPAFDYTVALATARGQAPFVVLAPKTLPSGWYATSADSSVSGPVYGWHLGLITDGGDYVGLEQSNEASQSFIAASTKADQPGEPVRIDGASWQTLTRGPETALVLVTHEAAPITTVVTGTAPQADLTAFASSLTND